jgi:uncharacterized protein (DUF433 family)
MTTLDWSQCAAVESIPGDIGGAWVLCGTRTPVKALFETLEAGMSIDEVIELFSVTHEQIDSLTTFVLQPLERNHELQSIPEQTGRSDRSAAIANEEDVEKLSD